MGDKMSEYNVHRRTPTANHHDSFERFLTSSSVPHAAAVAAKVRLKSDSGPSSTVSKIAPPHAKGPHDPDTGMLRWIG